MKSIPCLLFSISRIQKSSGFCILKFEITQKIIKLLKQTLHVKSLSVHAYIHRVVKFIRVPKIVILIPRIRYVCRDIHKKLVRKTEVILPDIILPYSNYCTKDLSALLLDRHDLNESFSSGVYLSLPCHDYLCDLLDSRNRHEYRKVSYLQYRYDHYLVRYNNLLLNTIGNLYDFCDLPRRTLNSFLQKYSDYLSGFCLITNTSVPVPACEHLTHDKVETAVFQGWQRTATFKTTAGTRFQNDGYFDSG